MPSIDSLFELFFKYPPSTFSSGSFRFFPSWPFLLAGLLLLALSTPGLLRYWRQGRGGARLLVAFRGLALLVVLLCLARPSLVLSTVVPQQSFVAVVVDDSKSMAVDDEGGDMRGRRALDLLAAEGGGLLDGLAERFKVRLFAAGRELRRVSGAAELTFGENASHLGEAMLRGADELGTVPLAGLVLLSDGADNSGATLDEILPELKARGVPVYTVGFGSERFERDIEVSRVEAPRRVLAGSSLMVEVTVEQSGYSGESVDLEVLDGGRIVTSQPLRFPATGEAVVSGVSFKATEAGPRDFQFRVVPRRGEVVAGNNQRHALIQVDDSTEKILYFEGEPRFELKFLRRAVADDDNLQLVVLQRTAENRFSRFELDDPTELAGGFPASREELFGYRGLILGSIEASFFTHDQLRMIGDFASQRGGGFLMLGGRRSFSEGGWAGTPVADMLPVMLGPAAGGEGDPFFSQLEVELTPWGKGHPALRLADSEQASLEIWQGLPRVSTFNPVTRLKPGATSLLAGRGEGIPGEQIVLAHQRYGRGRALAFTVHDSWRWQMHADVPVDDMSHETLWRQLLRWLVAYAPERVEVRAVRDIVSPGETVELVAEVRDESFLEINSARVTATVRTPAGGELALPLDWTVEKDGEYRGSFVAPEAGLYAVELEAASRDSELGRGSAWVQAAALDDELFDAELRGEWLRRVAEETRGRYYRPELAQRLVEEMALGRDGSTVIERRALWDMPMVFLVLITLLVVEWTLRRRTGLA